MIYMCIYIYTHIFIYIYIHICVRVVRNPMLRIRSLTICKYNKNNNNESPLQGTVNHDIFIVNQMVYKRYIETILKAYSLYVTSGQLRHYFTLLPLCQQKTKRTKTIHVKSTLLEVLGRCVEHEYMYTYTYLYIYIHMCVYIDTWTHRHIDT